MSLFPRNPRFLTRGASRLRDDRLFIVACDDTYAPKQYFNFFKLTRVQIHVVPTEHDGRCAAQHVLNRLLDFDHEEDDELWLLLDTDHYTGENHRYSFLSAIREARQKGVNVALSKPCFELWLLLHHLEESDVSNLEDARQVDVKLREVLGEYNKRNLKKEHYPLGNVCDAYRRAERLDLTVRGGDIPENNTSRVYQLWKAIVSQALSSQLPPELRDLLP